MDFMDYGTSGGCDIDIAIEGGDPGIGLVFMHSVQLYFYYQKSRMDMDKKQNDLFSFRSPAYSYDTFFQFRRY